MPGMTSVVPVSTTRNGNSGGSPFKGFGESALAAPSAVQRPLTMTSKLVVTGRRADRIDVDIHGRDAVLQFKRLQLNGDARHVELGEVKLERNVALDVAHRPPRGGPDEQHPLGVLVAEDGDGEVIASGLQDDREPLALRQEDRDEIRPRVGRIDAQVERLDGCPRHDAIEFRRAMRGLDDQHMDVAIRRGAAEEEIDAG